MRPYEDLSIAELVVYPLALIANIFVLLRHGISRQSGWIFLTTFCIIRIVGASFGVAYGKTGSINDFEWSAILGSVGIGALLASTAGLLQRVVDGTSTAIPREQGEKNQFEKIIRYIPIIGLLYRILYVSRATATSRRSRVIQISHLPSLAALVICIVGGTKLTSSDPSSAKEGKTLLKVGIIMFVCIFVILVALAAYTATEFGRIPSSEKRILAVVLVAMPLIAVRIVYSLLVYFSNIQKFNILYGNIAVRGVMSTLEEFLVIIAFTVVGLVVPPQYQAAQDAEMAAQGKSGLREQEEDTRHMPVRFTG